MRRLLSMDRPPDLPVIHSIVCARTQRLVPVSISSLVTTYPWPAITQYMLLPILHINNDACSSITYLPTT